MQQSRNYSLQSWLILVISCLFALNLAHASYSYDASGCIDWGDIGDEIVTFTIDSYEETADFVDDSWDTVSEETTETWDDIKNGAEDTWDDVENGAEDLWNDTGGSWF